MTSSWSGRKIPRVEDLRCCATLRSSRSPTRPTPSTRWVSIACQSGGAKIPTRLTAAGMMDPHERTFSARRSRWMRYGLNPNLSGAN